jgi:hypothetical protein
MKHLREIVEPNNAIHASIHTDEHVDSNTNFETRPPVISNDPMNESLINKLGNKLIEHYKHPNPYHEETLNDYSNSSETLNDYHWNLHHKKVSKNSSFEKSSKVMDDALSAEKTPHPITLYSGTQADPRKRKNKEGIVHHPAYLSTSISKDVAKGFARSKSTQRQGIKEEHAHILKINVPKEHNGSYIERISDCPTEQEFVLPRGVNMKHIKTVKSKPTPYYHRSIVYHTHHMEIV